MNERTSAQNPLIKYAEEIGWEYVSPDKALEEGLPNNCLNWWKYKAGLQLWVLAGAKG